MNSSEGYRITIAEEIWKEDRHDKETFDVEDSNTDCDLRTVAAIVIKRKTLVDQKVTLKLSLCLMQSQISVAR
jgi:hypothetical protein